MNLKEILKLVKTTLVSLAPQLKSKDSKEGIKELQEAIRGSHLLTLFLVNRLRDGAGFDDALALWDKLRNDDEFVAVLKEAYDGAGKIPAELNDIDPGEGLEIVSTLIDLIPDYIPSLKE